MTATPSIDPSVAIPLRFPSISIRLIGVGGLMETQWYRFLQDFVNRAGGEGFDKVTDNFNNIGGKADANVAVGVGNGLEGGGTLAASFTISLKQDTGWTAGTGTANKGVYAAYAGQTWGALYVAATAQTLDDAVQAQGARILALEEALRTVGVIN